VEFVGGAEGPDAAIVEVAGGVKCASDTGHKLIGLGQKGFVRGTTPDGRFVRVEFDADTVAFRTIKAALLKPVDLSQRASPSAPAESTWSLEGSRTLPFPQSLEQNLQVESSPEEGGTVDLSVSRSYPRQEGRGSRSDSLISTGTFASSSAASSSLPSSESVGTGEAGALGDVSAINPEATSAARTNAFCSCA
jgi:hypothetical protein